MQLVYKKRKTEYLKVKYVVNTSANSCLCPYSPNLLAAYVI